MTDIVTLREFEEIKRRINNLEKKNDELLHELSKIRAEEAARERARMKTGIASLGTIVMFLLGIIITAWQGALDGVRR